MVGLLGVLKSLIDSVSIPRSFSLFSVNILPVVISIYLTLFPDLDFLRYFTSGLGWVEVGDSLIASLLCWVIEGLLSTTGLGGCPGVG